MAGTRIRPAIMAKAPALMGDWRKYGKWMRKSILHTIKPEPNRKLTHTEAAVVFFQ